MKTKHILLVLSAAAFSLLTVSKVDEKKVKKMSKRQLIVDAALSQVGMSDPSPYWADTSPTVDMGVSDWCGGFALWALHQAGVLLNKHWRMGLGFLLTAPPLSTTKSPQIGDIAYFNHNEHHAVVVGVSTKGIQLANGNGANGEVSLSTVQPSQVTAFYSIEPYV